MARLFLLMLAGCTVTAVERADPSARGDASAQERGLIEAVRIQRGDAHAVTPRDAVPVLERGEIREASEFGSQEGEPIAPPSNPDGPDEADDADDVEDDTFTNDPAAGPDLGTDGDGDSDLDGDGAVDPPPPGAGDTGDTGDTGAE